MNSTTGGTSAFSEDLFQPQLTREHAVIGGDGVINCYNGCLRYHRHKDEQEVNSAARGCEPTGGGCRRRKSILLLKLGGALPKCLASKSA
mmetsp:Transcript_39500/g.118574  ORF Transcript_39500/g.118574 Transcript_39500/m.118574 type:complete len:90 (+) Transcript_39500:31-300(+)